MPLGFCQQVWERFFPHFCKATEKRTFQQAPLLLLSSIKISLAFLIRKGKLFDDQPKPVQQCDHIQEAEPRTFHLVVTGVDAVAGLAEIRLLQIVSAERCAALVTPCGNPRPPGLQSSNTQSPKVYLKIKLLQRYAGKPCSGNSHCSALPKRLHQGTAFLQAAPGNGPEGTVQQPGVAHLAKAEHHVAPGTAVEVCS